MNGDSVTNATIGNISKQEEAIAELNIKIVSAKDLRNTKIFGKMDPKVVIEYRNVKYKTDTDEDGHTEPIWNENVDIPIYSLDEELKIECLDIGIMFDETICSALVKITYI